MASQKYKLTHKLSKKMSVELHRHHPMILEVNPGFHHVAQLNTIKYHATWAHRLGLYYIINDDKHFLDRPLQLYYEIE